MNALALLVLALAAGAEQTDDPMIRWDCDRAGSRLVMEMVRPPLKEVGERELLLLSGAPNFEQCHINGGSWTLLVDLIEYDYGRCEPEPDTIVSLLRNDKLVIARAPIGFNCGDRPVLSAARITEPADGGEPTLELCTAESFGGEARCTALKVHTLRQAVDEAGVAAHARRR